MINKLLLLTTVVSLFACNNHLAPIAKEAIKPTVVTEKTKHDTDDPAIWVNPNDASQSLIIGTDKDADGALYAYNLKGKIINKVPNLDRPNNVDIAYGFNLNGKKVDIAVVTERNKHQIRIFSLPDLKPLDQGGIKVFEGEEGKNFRDPMGIALYTKAETNQIYAIVGRKTGPADNYLWQYELVADEKGGIKGNVVRKFGKYSGIKEIEAIAVDNELGYVYYSDEQAGIRKYYADPTINKNEELAFFGQGATVGDHEGIAIYKTSSSTGYILVSNQQNNSFLTFRREGTKANPNDHQLIADFPVASIECDGADANNTNFGPDFPEGIFVTMSNHKVFKIYDWRIIKEAIFTFKK